MRVQSEPAIHNVELENEIAVMILYDDIAAGRWAGEVFSSMSKSQSDDLHFRLQPWRLEFLSDPDWATLAALEAAGAELLVLSMSHPHRLSPRVEKWLRDWLNEKRGGQAALIVLAENADQEYPGHTSPLEFLKAAAREANVNFFSVLPPDPDSLQCFTPAPPPVFSRSSAGDCCN
jgi:hypothetical protein